MNIIPEPKSCKVVAKGNFIFNKKTELVGAESDFFADFKSFLERITLPTEKSNGNLVVSIDKKLPQEGYCMDIASDAITISGGALNGAFYGLQTLKQLLLEYKGKLPLVHIEDEPLYPFRAFMLDVGRYYYPVDDIKRYLDLMAMHKMNCFHWHLTEDQGFRVEIKKYPLLATKGSRRSHTNFGITPHEGYYTQEEVKDIVSYCHSRFIKVIPEIDVPGHMQAALACYPYLGCFNRKLKVATHWGVKHDILCAGKETTYQFLYDVLDELCELFTDGYFHIGGDEAVKTRWKICPHCQAEMARLGLKDEEELQQVFMSNINKYLRKKGYDCIMWNWDNVDNIDHLDRDIIWQFCGTANDNLTGKEVNNGMRVVVSTCFANYLDFPYSWYNLKTTYQNKPELDGVAPENLKNILGLEAPMWTEYVKDTKRFDFLTFPRLGAIAEISWTTKENRNYDKFISKLPPYYAYLDTYNVSYATLKQTDPHGLKKFFSSMWFNRRQLHWQGLHNLIDNMIVSLRYKGAK